MLFSIVKSCKEALRDLSVHSNAKNKMYTQQEFTKNKNLYSIAKFIPLLNIACFIVFKPADIN